MLTARHATVARTMEPDLYFRVRAPSVHHRELSEIIEYYDYKYELLDADDGKITRVRGDGPGDGPGAGPGYDTVEQFLLNEVFYRRKKNLHHAPVPNGRDSVVNFDVSPLDVVRRHPLLAHLLDHPLFTRYLTMINAYGTFFRFAGNKVQRLYWNPSINSGIPLTPKEKDPVYELVFLLHDFGHFLLPDLIFTGALTDARAGRIYCNWRLLSEAITVVLNEMLAVDYLKDTAEFRALCRLGFDKPYRLFKALRPIDLGEKGAVRSLFWASYQYFCRGDGDGFISLLDKRSEGMTMWSEFTARYGPVARRGREWTETNFSRLCEIADDYKRWWHHARPLADELGFRLIEEFHSAIPADDDDDDLHIMTILYDHVWSSLLEPLFFPLAEPTDPTDPTDPADPADPKCTAFKRYMLGNLFILTKHGDKNATQELITRLPHVTPSEFDDIIQLYRARLQGLYENGTLSTNEYHNARDIVIMLPPNILKKDSY